METTSQQFAQSGVCLAEGLPIYITEGMFLNAVSKMKSGKVRGPSGTGNMILPALMDLANLDGENTR